LAALARISPGVAGAITAALLLPLLADLSTARTDNTIFNINLQRTRRAGYLTGIGINRRAIAENRISNFIELLIREVGSLYQSIIDVHWKLRLKVMTRQSLGLIAMGVVVALVFTLSSSLADFALILFGYQRLQIAFGTAGQGASEAVRSLPFLSAASDVLSREAKPAQDDTGARPGTPPRVDRAIGPDIRLSVSNLSFAYPDQAVAAVHNFDFEFGANGTYLLRGRNGSGKTTLLSVLGGLFPSQTGELSLNGDALKPSELRRLCSLQPQRFFQFELEAGVVSRGVGSSGNDWERWAECFSLDEIFAGLKAGQSTILGRSFEGSQDISLGQWQRLILARAFAMDHPMLLLDEPTSFLDRRSVDGFHRALTMVRGRIVIISGHDDDLADVADVVLTLESGRLINSDGGTGIHRPTSSRTARHDIESIHPVIERSVNGWPEIR
jgi:ABC-type multidrug transport system fused ATPase/permease subunit